LDQGEIEANPTAAPTAMNTTVNAAAATPPANIAAQETADRFASIVSAVAIYSSFEPTSRVVPQPR
jgi:hypothetical protein